MTPLKGTDPFQTIENTGFPRGLSPSENPSAKRGAKRGQTPLIKFCGLSRPEDIAAANELKPDYIGFVFAPKSKRYVTGEKARQLKQLLDPSIKAVGVFVNEDPNAILELLKNGIIDIPQLHGKEDEAYIKSLKAQIETQIPRLTTKTLKSSTANKTEGYLRCYNNIPVFKAFSIASKEDIKIAAKSSADMILLDSKTAGSGMTFDWTLIREIERPYFLAGGLELSNVTSAIEMLSPYGVDISSGIETGGFKDKEKMQAFERAVRKGIIS